MRPKEGLLSTLLAGLLFGTSVPVIKLGLNSNIPPDLFVELRFAIASALVILFLRKKGWVRWTLFKARPIWIVGLINAGGYVTQFEGQALVSSSNAALIISTAALMIPILSLFYHREKIVSRKILGVVTGFLGTALVVTRGQPLTLGASEFVGDLLMVFTAVTIALVFVLSKKIVATEGGRPVATGILVMTSLFLLPETPIDQNLTIALSPTAWFCIIYLAVFATVGAYHFFMKGLEKVSATVSSIILPIEVIIAVILSVLLFNDPFNLYSGTGAGLIIAGVALVSTAA